MGCVQAKLDAEAEVTLNAQRRPKLAGINWAAAAPEPVAASPQVCCIRFSAVCAAGCVNHVPAVPGVARFKP